MKWILILFLTNGLSACIYIDSERVENREVIVIPPNASPSFVTKCSSIDVTTTRISGSRRPVSD